MAYKIGDIPSVNASRVEIADFLEIECLVNDLKEMSLVDISSIVGIASDEYENTDSGFEDSFFMGLDEVDLRLKDSSSRYPFLTGEKSILLNENADPLTKEVYIFLLLSTRGRMSENKIACGIDGTKLFERLCFQVAQNYFGNNAQIMIFGTGAKKSFSFYDKIENLLQAVSVKGYHVRKPDGDTGHHQDAGIDLVVFIPFADQNKGVFIGLGQCKTGTTWKDAIEPPCSFAGSFIEPQFVFEPINFYMVSESFVDSWEMISRKCGGLVFDRERIMQYLPGQLPTDLMNDIRRWNDTVINKFKEIY